MSAHDQWSSFVVRLRHACHGPVRLLAERQAHLNPARPDDVFKAREFCRAFGVVMALEGVPLPQTDQDKRILWVQAGSSWGSLLPLGQSGLWRVDAGCACAGMQAAGLIEPGALGAPTNLAQWFASAGRFERLKDSGLSDALVSVDWLLPDGTLEVFGPFGQTDDQPLRALTTQKLVPQLFELTMREQWSALAQLTQWPSRFHLDALADARQVNLAHLFAGHAGSLGWLVAATFRLPAQPMPAVWASNPAPSGPEALMYDQWVKQVVDPECLFLSLADQTG